MVLSLTCDYNKIIELPVPKTPNKKKDMLALDNVLASEEIDFLCNSLYSVTSAQQLGHGAFVIAAVGKWNHDARLLSMTNNAFQRFELLTMPILENTRT